MTDDWIEHDGKGMPVKHGAMVSLRLRDGTVFDKYEVHGDDEDLWKHLWGEADIVAYRVVKP